MSAVIAPYPNLRDAWAVLCIDIIPDLRTSDPDRFWWRGLRALKGGLRGDELDIAEAELSQLRRAGDVFDLYSPFWEVCCGEEGNPQWVKMSGTTHKALNLLCDAVGNMALDIARQK